MGLGNNSPSSSSSALITAQYNLLNCVDALKEISVSWPLAERCHRIMTGLMEAEGLMNPAEEQGASFHSPNSAFANRAVMPTSATTANFNIQPQNSHHQSYGRSRSVERRGFGFTPMHPEASSSDSQTLNQPQRERRRHDSTSGGEDDGLGSGGSGLRRSSSRTLGGGSHRAHPYLSRLSSTSSSSGSMGSHNRGHSHHQPQHLPGMESPTSGASGANFDFEPDSPSAITAASLLSLASSSANSSRTYLPSLGSNGSGDHHTPSPGSGGLGVGPHSTDAGAASAQMDFGQLPNPFSQPTQQPQDPAQTQLLDPYLVDFDPFSATGWATLDQDPFQQSFYMNA